jgi:hypothetical protein
MTTRSLPNNKQALVTFIARNEEIDALLRRIQGANADHFNTHPDEVHWGHVGTCGQVVEKLRKIAEFLKV